MTELDIARDKCIAGVAGIAIELARSAGHEGVANGVNALAERFAALSSEAIHASAGRHRSTSDPASPCYDCADDIDECERCTRTD